MEDFTSELQEAMHFDPTGIEGMKTLPELVDYCSDPNEVRRVRSLVNGFLGEDDINGHGVAAARWYPLLREAYPELVHLSLSAMLVRLGLRAHYVQSLQSNEDKLLQFLEYWSGLAEMTRQHIALGLRAAAFRQDVRAQPGCDYP